MNHAKNRSFDFDLGRKNGVANGEPRHSFFVLFGGRSGCGKTTLVNALVSTYPGDYARVRAFTSRARRPSDGEDEYEFVTRDTMHAKHQRGELLSLDEAYGEYYGMGYKAIAEILCGGRIPLREMHVKNHAAVRSAIPMTISALIQLADARWSEERGNLEPLRVQRLAEDQQFHAALKSDDFDIVHRITGLEVPAVTAITFHRKLMTLLSNRTGKNHFGVGTVKNG